MKKIINIFVCCLVLITTHAQSEKQQSRITSRIDSSNKNERVLIQEFRVNVALDRVWEAYTTKQGLESWAVPLVEIDWKVGGLIQSNYNSKGKIGDKTTIVNHIINYVPHKLITLQAELSPHFPDFMQTDAKDFYNVIYFSKIDDKHTKVESYGIGYKNTEEYESLLDFFISANEQSYLNLIKYLEQGTKVEFDNHE